MFGDAKILGLEGGRVLNFFSMHHENQRKHQKLRVEKLCTITDTTTMCRPDMLDPGPTQIYKPEYALEVQNAQSVHVNTSEVQSINPTNESVKVTYRDLIQL